MDTTYYIVCRVGWEYDDEYYSRSDDGGHILQKVYLTSAASREAMLTLNARAFAGLNISDYASMIDEVDAAKIGELAGIEVDSNEEIPDTLPLATLCQIAALAAKSGVAFYEVVQCSGEAPESGCRCDAS